MKGRNLISPKDNAFPSGEFIVDKEWDVKDLILELEEVASIPKVFVNGNQVKKCGDSYLSFLLDLSKQINFGEENRIQLIA